jgi:hypothetical protein
VSLGEQVVPGDGADTPVSGVIPFPGLPAGYEFSTLVADLIDVSKTRMDLSEATQAELRGARPGAASPGVRHTRLTVLSTCGQVDPPGWRGSILGLLRT